MMLTRVSRLIRFSTLKLKQSSRNLVTRRTNFRTRYLPVPVPATNAESTGQDQSKDKKWSWSDATKAFPTFFRYGFFAVLAGSYLYATAQKDGGDSQLGELFGIAPSSDLKVVNLSEKYDTYYDAIATTERGKKLTADLRAARKLPKLVSLLNNNFLSLINDVPNCMLYS